MAEIKILLQGLIENDDHDSAVNKLLELGNIDSYLLSLAFVRSNGVERLSENLRKISDKTQVFLGIRNGITSIQSILLLFRLGIKPYAVDTAANNKIFHPKIYAAYNIENAYVILGSANLTFGGLNRNIEASSYVKLNRNTPTDEEYLRKLVQVISGMPITYPEHVFQITTPKQAVALLKEGRLEDERLTRLPPTKKGAPKKERDLLAPIPTYTKTSPKPHKGINKRITKKVANLAILVWESSPLTERSLNIPSGKNTNITGDTNLGLGAMEDIDFQHYFRDKVFFDLHWSQDPSSKSPHLERAKINVELIIKNISYGVFNLEITHDPRTNTKSYAQRNVMTKIKWGDARPLIAKRDLLSRTLKLYKKGHSDFVIVID
ncbi:MAG: phospholipase D family protein [Gammaproteobacteria bacterium]|nr:phospholipase D family protein [Gammaproteobacteria bacterium]